MKQRISLAIAVIMGAIWFGPGAHAACHAVTITATSPVTEGGNVSVKIERDGAVGDSSFRIRTVDATATSPGDYAAYDQRVSFTGNQTSKSISIKTTEDATPESNETFTITSSEGQGCAANPNFTYGSDSVTIRDDDATPAPTPAPTRTPIPTTTTVVRTGIPTSTPSATPTGSPTPTPSTTPSASPSESPFAAPSLTPSIEEGDGGFPWLPVGIVAGFLAAAGGALALVRMRQSRVI